MIAAELEAERTSNVAQLMVAGPILPLSPAVPCSPGLISPPGLLHRVNLLRRTAAVHSGLEHARCHGTGGMSHRGPNASSKASGDPTDRLRLERRGTQSCQDLCPGQRFNVQT